MPPPTCPTLLCILDGFGLNPNPVGNAVAHAKKPCFDALWHNNPHTTLITFGERVGLPEGQMGNSEVGHMNIGAGRVVSQWLLRISQALSRGQLPTIPAYQDFHATTTAAPQLHLIGLVSDGGVHSHVDHLKLLIAAVAPTFAGKILLHVITDGRDTGPRTGASILRDLEQHIKKYPHVRVASVVGRFFAMDRDNRWERIEKAYRVICEGKGTLAGTAEQWVQTCYEKNLTDEFLEPGVIGGHTATGRDGYIFWNFREDRAREIVRAITNSTFDEFPRSVPVPAPQQVLCFTEYDHTYGLPFLFDAIPITHHLGEVVAEHGLRQLHTAETEKYPHVTYFFNAGVEKPYPGEDRVLVPSPRDVKTYDLKPEMSAEAVTDVVVQGITSRDYSFIVVNLANCDMVGHTGVLAAGIKAVEVVDGCLARMVAALGAVNGKALIIADHGNAEQMINYTDGTPHTSHTTYPVPCIALGTSATKLKDNMALCDVAPTILEMLEIEKPVEMTGVSLLEGKGKP